MAESSRIRHPLPTRTEVLVGRVEKDLKLKKRFKNFLTGWRNQVKFAARSQSERSLKIDQAMRVGAY